MGLEPLEIIMAWEDAFEISFDDDETEAIITPKIAIDLISNKLKASDNFAGVCLSARAYYRIRKAFCSVAESPRQNVLLDIKMRDLLPKKQRHESWKRICDRAGIPKTPSLNFGIGILVTPRTIRDLVDFTVARYPHILSHSDERWTRAQIRTVVRAVISDICGTRNFQDDDKFMSII